MLKNTILCSLFALSLSGCVGLNTVSMTQVPAERDNKITTNSSSWNFIGINFSNVFVDQAIEDLNAEKAFVVYSGDERYPLNERTESISLRELSALLWPSKSAQK